MVDSLVHLASASPRRRDILASLGIPHSWEGVDIDETPLQDESAEVLSLRLAFRKARESRRHRADEGVILAADTVVALDDLVFGKAGSLDDATAMLTRLSGRVHRVCTAVVVNTTSRELSAIAETEVHFRDIEPEEILCYWNSGEPEGKAGGYAIQGRGAVFVERLEGSWSGVVGLPVFETARMLREMGIEVLRGITPGRRL